MMFLLLRLLSSLMLALVDFLPADGATRVHRVSQPLLDASLVEVVVPTLQWNAHLVLGVKAWHAESKDWF